MASALSPAQDPARRDKPESSLIGGLATDCCCNLTSLSPARTGVVSCSCTFIYITLCIFVSLLVLGAFRFLLPVHRKHAMSWCCVHTLSLSPLSCSTTSGTCPESPRFVPRLVQSDQRGSASWHPSLPSSRPLWYRPFYTHARNNDTPAVNRILTS